MRLGILPAIVNKISLRCNVAFYRLLGHYNTIKKRAEIFSRIASALRERSMYRSFLKVKKFALKKSFKDKALKIHALCLLRNYVGNAHISMTKKLIVDIRQSMSKQIQIKKFLQGWRKIREKNQINSIKQKISEEEAKVQECNRLIDEKKHWFKTWTNLLEILGMGLEHRRMNLGFSRIKKYVVAKEVMLTKVIYKISSTNIPHAKKKCAFDKLRLLNTSEKYNERKRQLTGLIETVAQENLKIEKISEAIQNHKDCANQHFQRNLLNRIFFRLQKTSLYQFLYRVKRFQHEDQRKRLCILKLNKIVIRMLRIRFSGLLNISKEEIRAERKFIRAKKHLRRSKLAKVFSSMRHHTFSSRKGTIILRSLIILKARELLRDSIVKLRCFLVDVKLAKEKQLVDDEKDKISRVKDEIKALKEDIALQEEGKRKSKKKFEKSLIKKTLSRITRSARGKQLQVLRLLLTFKKKSDKYKHLTMIIVSITNGKLDYCFNRFKGKCLFEKERFLIEEIKQIREDYAELVTERQGLNASLIAFVKEKEQVELLLPKELRKLQKIKKRVEDLAGGDQIYQNYRSGLLTFYMEEWLVQFRRRAVLRKLINEERLVDLIGYFKLWTKNSRKATKKRESAEKWRKFVLKKEHQTKKSAIGTLKEFVLLKDQKMLNLKILQTKNDC